MTSLIGNFYAGSVPNQRRFNFLPIGVMKLFTNCVLEPSGVIDNRVLLSATASARLTGLITRTPKCRLILVGFFFKKTLKKIMIDS